MFSSGIAWTAMVGISGIVGCVLTAHIFTKCAERNSERRARAVQAALLVNTQVQIFGKLLERSLRCLHAAQDLSGLMDNKDLIDDEEVEEYSRQWQRSFARWTSAAENLYLTAQLAVLVAPESMKKAISSLEDKTGDYTVAAIKVHAGEDAELFTLAAEKFSTARHEFFTAASTVLAPIRDSLSPSRSTIR